MSNEVEMLCDGCSSKETGNVKDSLTKMHGQAVDAFSVVDRMFEIYEALFALISCKHFHLNIWKTILVMLGSRWQLQNIELHYSSTQHLFLFLCLT